jgi:hypothetical protein
MKNSIKILIISSLAQCLTMFCVVCWLEGFAIAAQKPTNKVETDHSYPINYLYKSASDAARKQQAAFPDSYIDPTLNQWLSLVLPNTVRRGLDFGAGYDRWEGLPTLRFEYFLPVKGWTDKSLFLAPRLNLTRSDESFSLSAGMRHLITSDALVGFYAFHDWTRSRRLKGDFLRQTGMGLELSWLPGYHSDLSFRINTYFPVNERRSLSHDRSLMIEESLPIGSDASVSLLLPALTNLLDFRVTAQAHSYAGQSTDARGYRFGLSANTRNGVCFASLAQSYDRLSGDSFRIDGSINLVFDWMALAGGQNPFSAPFKVSPNRYDRRVADALYEKVVRRYDLPTDRRERQIALAAVVVGDAVSFHGSFPEFPNSRVTVQVSQSPWRDYTDLVTDGKGTYRGRLTLPPGQYRLRMVHKASGIISEEQVVLVRNSGQ